MSKNSFNTKQLVVQNRDLIEKAFLEIPTLQSGASDEELLAAKRLLKNIKKICLVHVDKIDHHIIFSEKQYQLLEILLVQNLSELKSLQGRVPNELFSIINLDLDAYSLYNTERIETLLHYNLAPGYALYSQTKKLEQLESQFDGSAIWNSPFTEIHRAFQATYTISKKLYELKNLLYNLKLDSELGNIICNYLEGFSPELPQIAISNYLLCCVNDQTPSVIIDTVFEYLIEGPECIKLQELVDLLDPYFGSDSITIFKTLPSNIKFLITEYSGIEEDYISDFPSILGEADFSGESLG
ncbi:MAG: hypothetical protein NWS20_00985 [Rickettsiaceae bacterium]|nr:hypothetical protein [Rickettsiaceae bacterium]MDP5020524.1 hypothetical protein [Rickettsiaceae bacterium]